MATNAKSEPATVYMDSFTDALYLDKPGEVEWSAQVFRGIWDAGPDEAAGNAVMVLTISNGGGYRRV